MEKEDVIGIVIRKYIRRAAGLLKPRDVTTPLEQGYLNARAELLLGQAEAILEDYRTGKALEDID